MELNLLQKWSFYSTSICNDTSLRNYSTSICREVLAVLPVDDNFQRSQNFCLGQEIPDHFQCGQEIFENI